MKGLTFTGDQQVLIRVPALVNDRVQRVRRADPNGRPSPPRGFCAVIRPNEGKSKGKYV